MKHIKPLLRIAGFLLCLALLVAFANTHLLQTDTIPFLTMTEMKARSDIELAIIGSSVVRDHFNPELIGEETGLTTFDAAVPCASLPADLAMTETLFQTNSPQWVVLVMEPYNLNTTKEELEAEYKLMPMLDDPAIALRYYLRLCREDGRYLDRALLFRTEMASSLADVKKTFGLRYNTGETYEQLKSSFGEGITYQGAGFLRYDVEAGAQTLVRQRMIRREATSWEYSLMDETQALLYEYKALCEENDAQLMILLYPMHTAQALANPDYLPYNESLRAFCAQNDILCFDMGYAKPELMERLDDYYFDLDHMNGEGADVLSAAFAELFNRCTADEDVSGLFYGSRYEYLQTIDFITNCWVLPEGGNRYTADSNHAAQVTAEYRFTLVDAEGGETLLRDYGEETGIEAEIPAGCELRVYARPAGGKQDERVYFDYPTDYEAFYAQWDTR